MHILVSDPSDTSPRLELAHVDDEALDLLVDVAMSDADPDDVTPPLGAGWNPTRVAWLREFHRTAGHDLRTSDQLTAVVLVDGSVSGAIRLTRTTDTEGDSIADVEYGVWLARSLRGRGLHLRILRLTTKLAARAGVRRIVARTTATNLPVVATLRRAGASLYTREDGAVTALLDVQLPGYPD